MPYLKQINLPSLLDQLPIVEFSMIGSCKDHSSQNLKTKTQSKIFEKKEQKIPNHKEGYSTIFFVFFKYVPR